MSNCCDTSVLVPALVPWHPDHVATRQIIGSVDAVPAHVLLETFSVLTRFPAPHRIAAEDASAALGQLEFKTLTLPGREHLGLVARLARRGIRGGAVYDGLVAATAHRHDHTLLTRDRRARPTYDAIGVSYSLI